MSVLFAFPGQGSQCPGMLRGLPGEPEVARTLDEARQVLEREPLDLDREETLGATAAVQLALLIAGVAMARLLAARGAGPDMVAGMSVGAFPAAVAAGALDYADALRLVALRGRLMQDAFPAGYGMTAVIGLPWRMVEAIVAAVHSASAPVHVANFNGERQVVIAGAACALEAVAARARGQGARCEALAVSVPSHCELLAPAARRMQDALAGVRLRRPAVTYLSASAARPMADPQRIAEDLAWNMARPVHWHDAARLAWERGARLAVEMPSGDVLTGLTQAAFPDGLAVCCGNNSVETLCRLVAREGQSR